MEKLENRKWTVLASEYVVRRPWCTVRRDSLESPAGRRIPEYYVMEYPDWVNVIAVTARGEYLMVSQYRHGLETTDYELVAGVSEPSDASMLEAARRELLEETGYGGGRWRLLTVVAPNPATQNNRTYCFVAEGVEAIAGQRLDPTEEIRVHLLSLDEVKKLLHGDRIRQALMEAPLWRYLYEEGL